MSSDALSAEAGTPPMAEAAAPSWSAVKDAGVAADKGARRRMEVRDTHVNSCHFDTYAYLELC